MRLSAGRGVVRVLVSACVFLGLLGGAPPPAVAADPPAANIVVTYDGFTAPAKAAFEHAVARWEGMISSPEPIRVTVEFKNLGTGQLGHAGPSAVIKDGVWYSAPLASAMQGYDAVPGTPDITGEFNKSLTNWYFGTDGKPPAGKFDFVSVVMHELGHGLGFGGWAGVNNNGVGSWGLGTGYAGIYDTFTEALYGQRLLTYASPSKTLGSTLTGGRVYWGGAKGTAYNGGTRPRLFAPSTWYPGTSYSHLNESTYRAGTRNALMTPYTSVGQASHRPGPIVLGMLKDLGWQLGPAGRATVARLTLLSASVSDGSVRAGDEVTITGKLRKAEGGSALAGKAVTIYRRAKGTTSWTKGATKNTAADGSVRFVVAPTRSTQYELRHSGSTTTDADRSPIRTVTVS